MSRTAEMRKSNSLKLLRGTDSAAGGLLQIITGNKDPNAPIATLNHTVDLGSIGYLVAGGAALIVFNKLISQSKK
jgi:hypothetical protein